MQGTELVGEAETYESIYDNTYTFFIFKKNCNTLKYNLLHITFSYI